MTKLGSQVAVSVDASGAGEVDGGNRSSYQKYRKMRKHPTVSLARRVAMAPVLLQPWTFTGDSPAVTNFIREQLLPFRNLLLRTAVAGYLDYGWRGLEVIYSNAEIPSTLAEFPDEPERGGLRRVLENLKPLDNEITYQLRDSKTGDFRGLRQTQSKSLTFDGFQKDISPDECLFFNFDEDSFGEYGTGCAQIAEAAYDSWNNTQDGAKKYDELIAGAYRILKYPIGKSAFSDENGGTSEVDNATIAKKVLQSLKANGYATLPVSIGNELETDTAPSIIEAWKLELVTASGGGQPQFIARLKYLDALILRAYGVPERAATEGTFGTKAEAEAHADLVITVMQLVHAWIADAINTQLIDTLVQHNYGLPRGTVKIETGDLDKEQRERLRAMFAQLLPHIGAEAGQEVDVRKILEQTGVPVDDQAENSVFV